jgi:hypothetical protein
MTLTLPREWGFQRPNKNCEVAHYSGLNPKCSNRCRYVLRERLEITANLVITAMATAIN